MKKKQKKAYNCEKLHFGEQIMVIAVGIAMICDLIFPKLAFAEEPTVVIEEPQDFCVSIPRNIYCGIETQNIASLQLPSLPISKDVPIKTFWVYATAYSSTPDQTDDTPFITAMGTEVRDGVVATNILPFRARVKFPKEFGDKIFNVEDRMNRRYNHLNRVDIWMPTREEAIQFGARWLEAEVY